MLEQKTLESTTGTTATKVWDSKRKFKATVTTKYNQDNLRAAFVLERKKSGGTTWETIMMDQGLYELYKNKGTTDTAKYSKELYSTLWGTSASTTPILYDVSASEFKTFEAYAGVTDIYDGSQRLTDTTGDGSKYTNTIEFAYYPGGAIKQGYVYRVKALLFLTDNSGKMDTLVSLDANNSKNRYGNTYWTWSKYDYTDSSTLFAVTNMSVSNDAVDSTAGDNHKLTVTVSRRNASTVTNAGFLDGKYYVRLAKKTDKGWEVVTDPDCYGTTKTGYPSGEKSIFYKAFSMSDMSYQLTFQNLQSDTEYRLQFYGLLDTDNDNYVNITDSKGTYLAANDDTTKIFISNTPSTVNSVNNYYAQINQKYFSMNSYLDLTDYVGTTSTKPTKEGDFITSQAYTNLMLCASSSATTLKEGQRTTLGTRGTVNKDTNGKLTIQFNKTSGVEHLTRCDAELVYNSDDGTITDLRSGIITIGKGEEGSIMEGGLTEGTVTLSIESNNDLLNWSKYTDGTYSLILYFYDDDISKVDPVIKYDSNDITFW
jgi:hypothetical protein